jgi:hypothetical protein
MTFICFFYLKDDRSIEFPLVISILTYYIEGCWSEKLDALNCFRVSKQFIWDFDFK